MRSKGFSRPKSSGLVQAKAMVCRELGGYFARNYFGSMTLSPLI